MPVPKDDIYLDPNKKDYYYTDFIENVLTETDEFWKVSKFIKSHLIELNACKKIQPLYSKFPDNIHSFERNQSYLTMAYTKDIELILFRQILPYFIIRYNKSDKSKFFYTYWEPKEGEKTKKSKFKMGCKSNPDYFNINHLRLTFENPKKDKHIEFWDDLRNTLKEIK